MTVIGTGKRCPHGVDVPLVVRARLGRWVVVGVCLFEDFVLVFPSTADPYADLIA